jgi:hypothetical protein
MMMLIEALYFYRHPPLQETRNPLQADTSDFY